MSSPDINPLRVHLGPMCSIVSLLSPLPPSLSFLLQALRGVLRKERDS